jgi:hypothetical protein
LNNYLEIKHNFFTFSINLSSINLISPADYSVLLGTLKTDEFEDNRIKFDVPYKDIIVHNGWNKTGKLEDDIALIKLPVPLNLPNTANCKAI